MVRVNLINPKYLTDQHLVAEYVEILMLLGYVKKNRCLEGIPEEYCLGKGHIKFFKNKLKYLKERHELLKKEMKKRGFETRKTISLKGFDHNYLRCFKPNEKDKKIIKKRIIQKIKSKPGYYRYYGKKRNKNYLISLIKSAR